MISLLSFGLATSAQAQVIQIVIPVPLAPGANASQPINFATGNEYYALVGNITTALTAGSGHGMIVDTIGGANDSELAVYANGGAQLVAWNDDASTSPAGVNVGTDSVLTFGDEPRWVAGNGQGTYTAGANCVAQYNAPAGTYVFVVSYYDTVWGCPGATTTTRGAARPGTTLIHGRVF